MADRKAVVKNADMSEDMQQDAIDIATQALEKFNIEKDIAAFIKKEFDKKYNPTWHCIVGKYYTSHSTTHNTQILRRGGCWWGKWGQGWLKMSRSG